MVLPFGGIENADRREQHQPRRAGLAPRCLGTRSLKDKLVALCETVGGISHSDKSLKELIGLVGWGGAPRRR